VKRARPLNLRLLVSGVAAIVACLVCPFRVGVVYGQSMAPALHSGQICLLDRSFYSRHQIQVGDIVLFALDREVMAKRVYAAPGDSLTVVHYLDDGTYELPRDPLDKLRRAYCSRNKHVRLVTLRMGPNECFVLGDNSQSSYDSRQFGPVDTGAIIGKLVTSLD